MDLKQYTDNVALEIEEMAKLDIAPSALAPRVRKGEFADSLHEYLNGGARVSEAADLVIACAKFR